MEKQDLQAWEKWWQSSLVLQLTKSMSKSKTNQLYYLSSTNKQQETRMQKLLAKVKDEKKIVQEGIRED